MASEQVEIFLQGFYSTYPTAFLHCGKVDIECSVAFGYKNLTKTMTHFLFVFFDLFLSNNL